MGPSTIATKSQRDQAWRPKGQAVTLRLDAERDQIIEYLKKGVSKRSIARIIECSPATLYAWLKRRNIKN